MTILDRPPPGWKRPAMTLAAKVGAWELKHGPVQYDHRPPLADREFNTETNDTEPPANDPAFIEPITPDEHDKRTNGPGGEKRITTAGSDSNRRAKARRIGKLPLLGTGAVLLAADGFDPNVPITLDDVHGRLEDPPRPWPTRRIRSGGFRKDITRGFDGKTKPRKQRRRK